jgi:hypothetical protein
MKNEGLLKAPHSSERLQSYEYFLHTPNVLRLFYQYVNDLNGSLHIIIFSCYKKQAPFSLARRSLPKSKSFREHKYLFSRREIFFFMNKNIFFHENNSTIMLFEHSNS